MHKEIFYEISLGGSVTRSKFPPHILSLSLSDSLSAQIFLHQTEAPHGIKFQIVDLDTQEMKFIGEFKPDNPIVWEEYKTVWPLIFTDNSYSIY